MEYATPFLELKNVFNVTILFFILGLRIIASSSYDIRFYQLSFAFIKLFNAFQIIFECLFLLFYYLY